MAKTCEHIDQVRRVTARTPKGCEECLQMGSTWVHLRICLQCGHVGCCDSSLHKHARAHYHETDHAIVRSFEPREDWVWCYPHEMALDRAAVAAAIEASEASD